MYINILLLVIIIMSNMECEGCFECKDGYFPSNVEGARIKDAVNGGEYPWKVGSYDEKRFFKVIDSTDTMDMNGRKSIHKRHSNILFFSSPEAYMKHRRVYLDENIINEWYNLQNILFPDNKFDINAYKILKKC